MLLASQPGWPARHARQHLDEALRVHERLKLQATVEQPDDPSAVWIVRRWSDAKYARAWASMPCAADVPATPPRPAPARSVSPRSAPHRAGNARAHALGLVAWAHESAGRQTPRSAVKLCRREPAALDHPAKSATTRRAPRAHRFCGRRGARRATSSACGATFPRSCKGACAPPRGHRGRPGPEACRDGDRLQLDQALAATLALRAAS